MYNSYSSYNLTAFRRIYAHKVSLGLLLTSLALLVVSCGESPIPAGPPPSPTPSFRQETNQDLFFVMSVPINWVKSNDNTSVTFTASDDANLKLNVTTVSTTTPLTPDSTRILQEKLDSLKAKHPELRQDNAGFIRLVTDNVSLFKVTYADNGAEITEYMAQVNAPSSARAYLLVGRSPTASADQRRGIFLTSFESFKSNAPLVIPASLTAGANAGDPTALAANAGGKVSGDKTAQGKVTALVDWQSPPLSYGSARLTLQGLFPQDWQWRIKSFPTIDKTVVTVTPASGVASPGLYLTAPNSEAFIQIGVVPDVFRNDAPPSTDEYTKAIDPYLKSFNQSIASQGSRNSISNLENSGAFFRSTFVARNDSGGTNARGVILFRSAGRHLVVGAVTLGAAAATKNNLVEGYDADLQNLVSSIKVTT